MAKSYKATVKGKCWKQHTCLTCGSVYRYRFERTGVAQASTPQAAETAAHKALHTALTTTVDHRACPHCGLIQPEMIGQKRAESHGCMVWMSLVLAVVLLEIYGWSFAHYQVISAVALAGGAYIAFRHIRASLQNPNDKMNTNKVNSAADVAGGITELVQPGTDPGLDSVPMALSGGMKFAFMILLVSLLLFTVAELVRLTAGWSYNKSCYPPVAGPGETISYYTGDTIHSIKGLWSGTAAVAPQNEAELQLGTEKFTATTHQESWGTYIAAKTNEEHDSSDIYAELTVPNVPALAGKTVPLDVTIVATSPQVAGSSFNSISQSFQHVINLSISAPGSGRQYLWLWWGGIGGGLVLQILAGLILKSKSDSLKNGLPTQLISMT